MLTLESLINVDRTIKTKENFEIGTGLFLSDIKYGKLAGLARTAIVNFGGGGAIRRYPFQPIQFKISA